MQPERTSRNGPQACDVVHVGRSASVQNTRPYRDSSHRHVGGSDRDMPHGEGVTAVSAPGPTIDTGLAHFISSALLVEQIHQKGADGCCVGCRVQWRRLVPHPCTQAEWARLVPMP